MLQGASGDVCRAAGHHEEAGVLLAAGRVSVVLLLVTHRAATLALVILSRDTEVITTTLVSQTRVAIVLGSLPVHDHCPQIHLIVHQSLGIVSIRQLNHHHLLIHRVKIIQSSLHHSDGGGFVNCRSFVKNCSSVGSITVYRFNLNKTSELVFVFCQWERLLRCVRLGSKVGINKCSDRSNFDRLTRG